MSGETCLEFLINLIADIALQIAGKVINFKLKQYGEKEKFFFFVVENFPFN
jgi:hypothetical protein